MIKKNICEIKLFKKNGDCLIEYIDDIFDLMDQLHNNISNEITNQPDGRIVIKDIEVNELVSVLESLGYEFENIIEVDYGLRLLYEC